MTRRSIGAALLVLALCLMLRAVWVTARQDGRAATGADSARELLGDRDAPHDGGSPERADAPGARAYGTLAGSVLERGTERPLANVTVLLLPRRTGGRERLSAVTDDAGDFAFDAVPSAGAWELAVPGHALAGTPQLSAIRVPAGARVELGAVHVEPSSGILGRVVADDGTPVAGALVRAFDRGPGTRGRNLEEAVRRLAEAPVPDVAAQTSGDGTFLLACPRPGSYDLVASAAGHGLAVVRGAVAGPLREADRLTIALEATAPVLGGVAHRLGGRVAGLRVAAFVSESTADDLLLFDKVLATTEADGRFRLDGLSAVERGRGHIVCVIQENGVRTTRDKVDVTERRIVEIVIGGDVVLEGVVSDHLGHPVAGAEVFLTLQPERNVMVLALTRSGADGRYRLSDLPLGPVEGYLVTAEGFAPFPAHPAALIDQHGSSRLELTGGRNVLDVRLDGEARVRGVVREGVARRPLAGVRVTLLSTRGRFGHLPADVTGPDGTFSIPGSFAERAELVLWKDGWTTSPGQRLTASGATADSAAEALELTMDRAVRVRGRVLSPDGQPVSGALVALHPADALDGPDAGRRLVLGLPERRRTDASGRFELEGAGGGGQHVLHASADGYLPAVSAPLVGPPATDLEAIELRLREPATLEVVVTGADGTPVEGATVSGALDAVSAEPRNRSGRPLTGRTAHDGTFRADALDAGTLTLRVEDPGHLRHVRSDLRLEEGATLRVAVTLAPGGAIEGVVLRPDRSPFAGATVRAEPGSRGERHHSRADRTDGAGRFVLPELPAGQYRLRAEAPGFAASEEVLATTGDSTTTLVLRPGASIAGSVRFADGSAPAGAVVTAWAARRGQSDGPAASAVVGADGAFRVQGLAEGLYDLDVAQRLTLSVPHPNVVPMTVPDVATGTSDLELLAEIGRTVGGRVVAAGSRLLPPGEAWAEWTDAAAPTRRRLSLARIVEGRFEVDGLHAGPVRLTITVGALRVALDVTGEAHDLRVELPESGGIRGGVLLPGGLPAPGATVRVTTAEPHALPSFTTTAGIDGRFELSGLAVGVHSLWARQERGEETYEVRLASVVVSADTATDVGDLEMALRTD